MMRIFSRAIRLDRAMAFGFLLEHTMTTESPAPEPGAVKDCRQEPRTSKEYARR